MTIERLKELILRQPVPPSEKRMVERSQAESTQFFDRLEHDDHQMVHETLQLITKKARESSPRDEMTPDWFSRENLTKFGKMARLAVRGRTFFDLGCGSDNESRLTRFMAEAFGARRYVGVDNRHVQDRAIRGEFGMSNFRSYLIKMNVLEFLWRLNVKHAAFFISGMEDRASPFPAACRNAIIQKAIPRHTTIILGYGTSQDFDPGSSGSDPRGCDFRALFLTHSYYLKTTTGVFLCETLSEQEMRENKKQTVRELGDRELLHKIRALLTVKLQDRESQFPLDEQSVQRIEGIAERIKTSKHASVQKAVIDDTGWHLKWQRCNMLLTQIERHLA